MRKIIVFFIALATVFGIASGKKDIAKANGLSELANKNNYTFLVCGIDDAAENTDAIIVFDYDLRSNSASFIQIPRDTYINADCKVKKINSIYPTLRNKGSSKEAAMNELCLEISQVIGKNIDGYVGYTTAALGRIIDIIGGIDIVIPSGLSISDEDGQNNINLKEGNNHLSGEDAVRFVRYRSGYSLGDLGRIDAQKLFLSAFVDKLKSSINFSTAMKLALNDKDGIITNSRAMDVLNIGLKIRGRLSQVSLSYSTLPGTARECMGKWFYFINKNASIQMLDALGFKAEGEFDKNMKLLSSDKGFENLYFDTKVSWKIYSEEDLGSISIPHK